MTILVTGTAGFIGNAVALKLLARGDKVIGIDNLNDYYDVGLKKARLERVLRDDNFINIQADLQDTKAIDNAFREHQPEQVINLAAQAGVRYSLQNPHTYVDSNVTGFLNVLESCKNYDVKHLVYASTSSVYGANTNMPFSVHNSAEHPVSLYAATKKANEMMAHAYSHLYDLAVTGLRFFTVYGPWGRPDMALFLFTKSILAGEPIKIFNHGNHRRDFTYIDDIVAGIIGTLDNVPIRDKEWTGQNPDPASSSNRYRLYNIGNNAPVRTHTLYSASRRLFRKKGHKRVSTLTDGRRSGNPRRCKRSGARHRLLAQHQYRSGR